MKALVAAREDRIVGFTMIGPEAGEVMAAVQMAMLGGLPSTAPRCRPRPSHDGGRPEPGLCGDPRRYVDSSAITSRVGWHLNVRIEEVGAD